MQPLIHDRSYTDKGYLADAGICRRGETDESR